MEQRKMVAYGLIALMLVAMLFNSPLVGADGNSTSSDNGLLPPVPEGANK